MFGQTWPIQSLVFCIIFCSFVILSIQIGLSVAAIEDCVNIGSFTADVFTTTTIPNIIFIGACHLLFFQTFFKLLRFYLLAVLSKNHYCWGSTYLQFCPKIIIVEFLLACSFVQKSLSLSFYLLAVLSKNHYCWVSTYLQFCPKIIIVEFLLACSFVQKSLSLRFYLVAVLSKNHYHWVSTYLQFCPKMLQEHCDPLQQMSRPFSR
jgi:hypothetical protein